MPDAVFGMVFPFGRSEGFKSPKTRPKRKTDMKKIVLGVIALIAGVFTDGVAQSRYYQSSSPTDGVKIGIRAGYNGMNWEGDAVESAKNLLDYTDGNVQLKMRHGFHAGAYLSLPLGSGIELEPGLLYSQKGVVMEGNVPGNVGEMLSAKATITNKSEYLDVPLLLRFYVADGFNLFAGPQVSFLLSNKVNVKAGALGFNALDRDFDWNSGQRKVDVGLAAGVGYQFQNGFNVNGGYDFGLTTIDDNATYKTYNRGFKASIGYRF